MNIKELIRLADEKMRINQSMIPLWKEVILHSQTIKTEKELLSFKEELSNETLKNYDFFLIMQIVNNTCDRLNLEEHMMNISRDERG